MSSFKWLIGMYYQDGIDYMAEYFRPYYLHPSKIDEKIIICSDNVDPYRIFVEIKNDMIVNLI